MGKGPGIVKTRHNASYIRDLEAERDVLKQRLALWERAESEVRCVDFRIHIAETYDGRERIEARGINGEDALRALLAKLDESQRG